MVKFRYLTVVVAALAQIVSGCGSSSKSTTGSSATTAATTGTTGTTALSGSVTVLAASSLTKAFTALGTQFQAAHPGTKITFSFGSSSDLETQISQGAPADVFASADEANMDKVVAAHDNAGDPANFAKNKLEIAVEKGNPMHIAALSDLTKSGVVVVLCDPSAPCGKFANQVLSNAKVTLTPKSRELNAKATLSKVELGEADAAIVYVSDVKTSGKVDGVQIPDAVNVLTTLPIVTLKDSKNSALAQAWVTFVLSHQTDLDSTYGFLPL
jgi:molybdate transport system substrate-binding protein